MGEEGAGNEVVEHIDDKTSACERTANVVDWKWILLCNELRMTSSPGGRVGRRHERGDGTRRRRNSRRHRHRHSRAYARERESRQQHSVSQLAVMEEKL